MVPWVVPHPQVFMPEEKFIAEMDGDWNGWMSFHIGMAWLDLFLEF